MEAAELYTMADAAGKAAVESLNVVPMNVARRANPFDDTSEVLQSWHVPDGVCGFAWVQVKPANSRFAKYLLKIGAARRDSYNGGVCLWVSAYNQSMQRKEAYATAFAKVLIDNGINAYSDSRMD